MITLAKLMSEHMHAGRRLKFIGADLARLDARASELKARNIDGMTPTEQQRFIDEANSILTERQRTLRMLESVKADVERIGAQVDAIKRGLENG